MKKTQKQFRTKQKRKTRRLFQNVNKDNAYHSYKHLEPIVLHLFDTHPHLLTSYNAYKGFEYVSINSFMKDTCMTLSFDGKSPTLSPESTLPTDNKDIHELYKKSLKEFEKRPDQLMKAAYCNTLMTITHIENLRSLFKLFAPYRMKRLPILYRGLSEIRYKEGNPMKNVKIGSSISIPYFQSCSKSYDVALGFQGCSQYGPCCIFILNVHPDVHYIPVYWVTNGTSIWDSYKMSEHEILLEPFVEYKLRKKYMKDIDYKKATICDYSQFSKNGSISIQVYEIDVLPPKKENLQEYTKKISTLYKGWKETESMIQGVKKFEIQL